MYLFPLMICLLLPLEDEEQSLQVLPANQTVPAERLLYEQLRQEAHAALDRRQAEFEAIKSPADLRAYQEKRREFFRQQLGGFPERTPLHSQIVGKIDADGYHIEKVIFESQPRHHVTALMYVPDSKPPYPAVVISCGHSRTGKAADYNQRFGIILARNGIAALCYDPIGQGERSQILDQQGEVKHSGTTTEHFLMGVGSILLGTNTARYRVYDGMRAIDYLTSREDVIAERIGFTGCSGGGTVTSYVMALDDRVYCAAPACYLTTFGQLIDSIGPQDAEQNIFGQISVGMDQPDYVLMRAPRPTLISATTDDFFSIAGSWENFRQAKRAYTLLGYPERVDLVEGEGKHGVPMGNLNAIMRWMRRWLLNADDYRTEPEIAVHPLEALQCTPEGQVLKMADELSVFALNALWQERLAEERKAFWSEHGVDDVRKQIRKLAGIRELSELTNVKVIRNGELQRDGYRIEKIVIEREGDLPLPALLFVPAKPSQKNYLYLHGLGKQTAAAADGEIEQLVKQGHLVMAVDLPGNGETRGEGAEGQLGDWKNFYMAYLLGKSLVGMRSAAILQCGRLLATYQAESSKNRPSDEPREVHLLASGETAIPALHAAALEPDTFQSLQLRHMVGSWAEVVRANETENQLTGTVHAALRTYDLPDLINLYGKQRLTLQESIKLD